MRTARAVFCIVCVALVAAVVLPAAATAADGTVRIGTYDNRAIAIAYARTQQMPFNNAHVEYDRAEAAGDSGRMQEISDEMEALQRKLHRQGFGRVPVDDLLEPVAHRLPELAIELGVDAIVWICDFAGEDVEVVDITLDIVGLYGVDEATLAVCKEVFDHEPLDLDEIDHVE